MRIAFTIERPERMDVVIMRSWFSGKMTLTANGNTYEIRSPHDLSTHFNVSLKKTYTVEVPAHVITVDHTRPLWMSGLRPQEFTVFVDGENVAFYRGY